MEPGSWWLAGLFGIIEMNIRIDGTWQYMIYLLLSLLALIFTVILLPSSSEYFRRFFGELNPTFVVILTSAAGAAALWGLGSTYKFVIFSGKNTLRGLAISLTFATILAGAIVVADIIFRYLQDTNVPVPQALLFYPAVGVSSPRSSSTSYLWHCCCSFSIH